MKARAKTATRSGTEIKKKSSGAASGANAAIIAKTVHMTARMVPPIQRLFARRGLIGRHYLAAVSDSGNSQAFAIQAEIIDWVLVSSGAIRK